MTTDIEHISNLVNIGYVGLLVKTKDNKFLLLHRRPTESVYPDAWSIPSTQRTQLESAQDCAIRAYKKDTTMDVQHKQNIRYISKFMNNGGYYYVYLYIVDRPFRIWPDGRKYLDFKWFSVNELPENITPEVASAIHTAVLYQ